MWEEYPEYYNEPSKFEDRVKSKIGKVVSYFNVVENPVTLPMDLANKYRGASMKLSEQKKNKKSGYVHNVSLFDTGN